MPAANPAARHREFCRAYGHTCAEIDTLEAELNGYREFLAVEGMTTENWNFKARAEKAEAELDRLDAHNASVGMAMVSKRWKAREKEAGR